MNAKGAKKNMVRLGNTEYKLTRYPETRENSMRAWDAADEYILRCLDEIEFQNVLICCDAFGALSLPLLKHGTIIYTDSMLSSKAIRQNIQDNDTQLFRTQNGYTSENDLRIDYDLDEIDELFDLILLKLPKSAEYCRYLVAKLSQKLSEEGLLLAGGMTKYFRSSTVEALEHNFEKVDTTLAWKKARLAYCRNPKHMPVSENKNKENEGFFSFPEFNLKLFSTPGVFAHGRIDIGTRSLLECLRSNEVLQSHCQNGTKILDMGCGSGAIGCFVGLLNNAEIHFIDESFLAIQAAKKSVDLNGILKRSRFYHSPGAAQLKNSSEIKGNFDVVLSNPPFHYGGPVSLDSAFSFFRDARDILRVGGAFIIVANNHLGYEKTLQRLYSKVNIIKKDRKFKVILSIK